MIEVAGLVEEYPKERGTYLITGVDEDACLFHHVHVTLEGGTLMATSELGTDSVDGLHERLNNPTWYKVIVRDVDDNSYSGGYWDNHNDKGSMGTIKYLSSLIQNK